METLQRTLAGPELHEAWTATFHGAAAQPFFEDQFDEIAETFRSAPKGDVLDMGCGPGHHTRRLVERGFAVVGADFSESALKQAQERIPRNVRWVQADITQLPFVTGEFTRILCYGVLMHVPELEDAVAELARVLAPGGVLIVSEGNMHSFDDLFIALVRRLRNKPPVSRRTPRGGENWIDTPTGRLFIRHSDIPSLVREFGKHGLTLRSRRPGQFSESYVYLPRPLAGVVHRFNRKRLTARLSFGTLLTFERPPATPSPG
jgi:SAM-dependent methyltransferase